MSLEEVEEMFREEGTSNYLVVFLRLLTSKQLQVRCRYTLSYTVQCRYIQGGSFNWSPPKFAKYKIPL